MQFTDLSEDDMTPVSFMPEPPKPAMDPGPNAFFEQAATQGTVPTTPTVPQAAPPAATVRRTLPQTREPAVIAKMRAIAGRGKGGSPSIRIPIYVNNDADPAFTYSFRIPSREDHLWAVRFAVEEGLRLQVTPQVLIELAMTCVSIAGLDMGSILDTDAPTPIWQALEIKPESPAHVRDPYYPHVTLRDMCAQMMYDMFSSENNAFADIVADAYREHVLPKIRFSLDRPGQETDENPTTSGS